MLNQKGNAVKNIVSAAVLSLLLLGSATVSASALKADMSVAKTAVLAGEPVRLEAAIFRAGGILNRPGANIFWVLGGGLVAVSLLARRISS
jgi:hypothetical protein